MDLRPGTVVAGTYEITGPLGRGGMGELFRARNVRTERQVALKLLRPDNKYREDAIERFRREARAAGMIKSDHVTQVLGVEDDPKLGIAIAFELLEGESLLERLRRTGPMSLETIFPLVQQILRGLHAAHAVDIIHRDLKPSNVFLESRFDEPDRVKILDFGISKLPKTIAKTTLTEPGQSLGSFMFMPPEQIQRAANVDLRADIYALGTLVFQAMTGHLPYSARNMVELVTQKTSKPPRTLSQASGKGFDPQLEAWVARCLALDAGHRFQTAKDAADAWKALNPAWADPSRASGQLPAERAALAQGAPPPAPHVQSEPTGDQTIREQRPRGLGGTMVMQPNPQLAQQMGRAQAPAVAFQPQQGAAWPHSPMVPQQAPPQQAPPQQPTYAAPSYAQQPQGVPPSLQVVPPVSVPAPASPHVAPVKGGVSKPLLAVAIVMALLAVGVIVMVVLVASGVVAL